jgi:hypothetical protein
MNRSFFLASQEDPLYVYEAVAPDACSADASVTMVDGEESADLASTLSADARSAADSSVPDDDTSMDGVAPDSDAMPQRESEEQHVGRGAVDSEQLESGTPLPKQRVENDAQRQMQLARALAALGCDSSSNVSVAPAVCGPLRPATPPETPGLDVAGLESAYTLALASGSTDVAHELLAGTARLLDELEPLAPAMVEPESLRCLLPLWLSPTNSLPSASAPHLARLCGVILALPQASRDRVIAWVGSSVPGALFGSRVVRPLLAHASHHLERILAGNPGGPVAMTRLPTFAAAAPAASDSTPSTTGGNSSRTQSGGVRTQTARAEGRQSSAGPAAVGVSAAATAVPWTSAGGEGAITHMSALELLVRTLRLCYNLNERLAEQARAELALPPASRQRKRQGVLDDAGGAPMAETQWAVAQAPPGALLPHHAFYRWDLSLRELCVMHHQRKCTSLSLNALLIEWQFKPVRTAF